jgi:hypothetical protein
MYHVSYFKAVDSQQFVHCFDHHALMYPERSESVLMVPGSYAQMRDDMLAQDDADLEYAARYYGYR